MESKLKPWELFDSLDVGTVISFENDTRTGRVRAVIINSCGIYNEYSRNGKSVFLIRHSNGKPWGLVATGYFNTVIRNNEFTVEDGDNPW